MKLDQTTRKRLYKAAPRSIEITWPVDGPDPHSGKRYAVYNEEGNRVFTILLERSKKGPYETKARVRIDSDPVRILPGLSGSRREDNSYETEPERVSEVFEDKLAIRARQETVIRGAEHREAEKREGKEARRGSSRRSERAIGRHQRSLKRKEDEWTRS